jgi:glutathione synthase/RimK-type ligase-like ATP-grasp enzyme
MADRFARLADAADQGPIGFAALSRIVMSGIDIATLGARVEERARRHPGSAGALLDLATTLFLTMDPGHHRLALQFQARALALSRHYRLAAARPPSAPPRLRLLALYAPGDMTANTPVDCLLEESDVDLELLYLGPGETPPAPLPAHDALFVAIGESDDNQPLLRMASELARRDGVHVVNQPDRIARLTRDLVARDLGDLPGVLVPATLRIGRTTLESASRGAPLPSCLDYPLIARPVGSQAGRALTRVESPEPLVRYLAEHPHPEYFIAPFIDYSSSDGRFRKARVVLVGGRPFPCHLAISSRWMVHYANADMDSSAEKRAEEARWMERFDADFASRHRVALAAIVQRIGLDYFAIDCAETPDGRLLVFEVDNAMIVHSLDPPEPYGYKLPHMRRVFGAFRALLGGAARA